MARSRHKLQRRYGRASKRKKIAGSASGMRNPRYRVVCRGRDGVTTGYLYQASKQGALDVAKAFDSNKKPVVEESVGSKWVKVKEES